jgi:hypothetical protein
MRPSETLIKFFNRFEDALRNHVMLHGRDMVETGSGQKFICPPRAFVEDNCCVEDKNKECMRIYGQAILTDSSKESYLLPRSTSLFRELYTHRTGIKRSVSFLSRPISTPVVIRSSNLLLRNTNLHPNRWFNVAKNKKPCFHTQGRNQIQRVHCGAISRGIHAIRIGGLIQFWGWLFTSVEYKPK